MAAAEAKARGRRAPKAPNQPKRRRPRLDRRTGKRPSGSRDEEEKANGEQEEQTAEPTRSDPQFF